MLSRVVKGCRSGNRVVNLGRDQGVSVWIGGGAKCLNSGGAEGRGELCAWSVLRGRGKIGGLDLRSPLGLRVSVSDN